MSARQPADDPFLRPIAMYFDAPYEALQTIKTLWEAWRGSVEDEPGELQAMLAVLALCFRKCLGRGPGWDQDQYVLPSPQDDIWEAFLAVGLPVILLDMINDESFVKRSPDWIGVVLKLNSDIAEILATYANREALTKEWLIPSSSLEEAYFERLALIGDTLWKEIHVLIDAEEDNTESLVLFGHFVITLHTTYYPEHQADLIKSLFIVKVLLAAWTCAVTKSHVLSRPNRHCLHFVDMRILHYQLMKHASSELSEAEKDISSRLVINMIVEDIGALDFMRACCIMLATWDAIHCLQALGTVVSFPFKTAINWQRPSLQAFLKAPMLASIVKALDREHHASLKSSHSSDRNVTYLRASFASCALAQAIMLGIYSAGIDHLEDGGNAYKILSHLTLALGHGSAARYQSVADIVTASDIQRFSELAGALAVICSQFLQRPHGGQPDLKRIGKTLVSAARQSWYENLHQLRSLRDRLDRDADYNNVIRIWVIFGEALGLVETEERDVYDARRKHRCSWVECRYHVEPFPEQLSVCSGCGEQRYCSRACQTKDWKQGGHRSKCRRLTT